MVYTRMIGTELFEELNESLLQLRSRCDVYALIYINIIQLDML
jgi:hypothetical protein